MTSSESLHHLSMVSPPADYHRRVAARAIMVCEMPVTQLCIQLTLEERQNERLLRLAASADLLPPAIVKVWKLNDALNALLGQDFFAGFQESRTGHWALSEPIELGDNASGRTRL